MCSFTKSPLSSTVSRSLLRLMPIEPVMPSNYVILCRPLLLPSIFPSMRVFSSESALGLKRPKYWSFSISISLSTEYSGLISFGMDGCDLLGGHDSEHWKVPDASIQTGPISLSPHVVFQRGLVLHPRGGAEAGSGPQPCPGLSPHLCCWGLSPCPPPPRAVWVPLTPFWGLSVAPRRCDRGHAQQRPCPHPGSALPSFPPPVFRPLSAR